MASAMNDKARKGRLFLGGLILLGLSLLGLSASGCCGVSLPAFTVPTEAANPGGTAVSPVVATPTNQATPAASSPTATPLSTDQMPTQPPVAPKEGFTAPDFSLPDLQGNIITLSQFRGRPVLVNFWTTWCPYCVEEMDALEKTYRRYADQGLVVLAVNVQEKAKTVTPVVQAQNLSFPILLDSDASITRAYFTIAIPTSFFIDRQGVVRVIHLGPLTEETIDTYLSDLLSGG